MSNWRDKLKESQGQGKSFVKLDPIIIFEVKRIENKNESAFEYYDRADEKRYQIAQSLTGIIIGKAMRASFWDEKTSTGYSSVDYFSHKELVMFRNGSKDRKPVFRGTFEQATTFFQGRLIQRQIIYLATKKGLYAVVTNLSIAIDQFKQVQTDLPDFEMKLTPCLYTGKEEWISKGAKDILAKVALKNPPSYARIERSSPITDEMAVLYNLEELASKFKDYREANTVGMAIEPEEHVEQEPIDQDASFMPDPEPELPAPIVPQPKKKQVTPTPSDDLPFILTIPISILMLLQPLAACFSNLFA